MAKDISKQVAINDKRISRLEILSKEAMDVLHRLDERMEHMDHIIRGNGSPGLVTKIEILQTQTEAIRTSLADAKETAKETVKTKSDHAWAWKLAAGSAVFAEVLHWLIVR